MNRSTWMSANDGAIHNQTLHIGIIGEVLVHPLPTRAHLNSEGKRRND